MNARQRLVAAGPSTTAQYALDGLREAIVSGRLRPGQRMRQEELAEQLGVSVAPIREALRILEQEGQAVYFARRGYFVSELEIADLEEIYELRAILEERAARRALPTLDAGAVQRIAAAGRECAEAAELGDVGSQLDANRRFHLAILAAPEQPHTIGLIRVLWDRTEAYRALYYNSPAERQRSIDAHDRILQAVLQADADLLVAELDAHRDRALVILTEILDPGRAGGSPAAPRNHTALLGPRTL